MNQIMHNPENAWLIEIKEEVPPYRSVRYVAVKEECATCDEAVNYFAKKYQSLCTNNCVVLKSIPWCFEDGESVDRDVPYGS